jgi:uncharacterized phage protein gp47/JayE
VTYAIGQFTTKTAQEIHDDYLRTMRNGMIQLGVSNNPQLGPGSDEDIRATALANEIAPLYANTQIKADAQMADSATGDVPAGQNVGADLQRLMAIRGLAPRGPVPSSGFIELDCSATTIIQPNQALTDASGLAYTVQTPGTYADGALVPVIASIGGANTDHEAGDTLTWVSAPPYCNTKQLVASGGLTGGADAEDNETARARLLTNIQDPPGSGNSAQVCKSAEDSTDIVQKAFAYPAVNGPSTLHVAVVGYTSDVSQSREVDALVMSGTVVPFVVGAFPEFTELVITIATDQPTDIAVGITIPSSPQASPPGLGGGWIDGQPWPAISGTSNTYANVTAVTSSTQFTVNAPTAPQAGISHICMVDTTTWSVVRAKVLTVSGSAGAYVVTIDTPFPNVVAAAGGDLGTLIFPDATNMDTYVANFLAAMGLMGPGEKTTNVSVLTRGYRHPPPTLSWPYSLNSLQLKAVENSGQEVTQTLYYFKSNTTPTVPSSVSSPPFCLITRRLGLYPI